MATTQNSNDEYLMRACGISKQFVLRGSTRTGPRKIDAVRDVSFGLKRGETLGVVGESGSGKSTMARIVGRLIDPTSGTIAHRGREITNIKKKQLDEFRSHLQFVFQDPYASLNPRRTVGELIVAPYKYLKAVKSGRADLKEKAAELIEMVELPRDYLNRYPRQLSGGQAQRVGIARALSIEPEIVICDEAVSALDVTVQAQILSLLQRLQDEKGISYLFITHDMAVVNEIADRVMVMKQGSVVELGEKTQVLEHPEHDYTRQLLRSVPTISQEWLDSRSLHERHN